LITNSCVGSLHFIQTTNEQVKYYSQEKSEKVLQSNFIKSKITKHLFKYTIISKECTRKSFAFKQTSLERAVESNFKPKTIIKTNINYTCLYRLFVFIQTTLEQV